MRAADMLPEVQRVRALRRALRDAAPTLSPTCRVLEGLGTVVEVELSPRASLAFVPGAACAWSWQARHRGPFGEATGPLMSLGRDEHVAGLALEVARIELRRHLEGLHDLTIPVAADRRAVAQATNRLLDLEKSLPARDQNSVASSEGPAVVQGLI